MKKIFFTTALIIILLVVSIIIIRSRTVFTSGDYVAFSNIGELAFFATDVVRVEVLDERVQLTNTWLGSPQGGPYNEPTNVWHNPYEITTVNNLLVLEVFKGNMNVGDVAEVMQLGGRLGLVNLNNKQRIALPINGELILFMRSFDDGLPAVLLNPLQSIYHVISEGVFQSNFTDDSPYSLELTLTLDDLQRVAQGNYWPFITQTITAITQLITIIIMMFSISWQLTIIALLTVPISFAGRKQQARKPCDIVGKSN